MKAPPADHRTSQRHKGLVDISASVESRAQAAELMEQGQRLFDHVTEDAQATAMLAVAAGDGPGEAPAGALHPVRGGGGPPAPHPFVRRRARRAGLFCNPAAGGSPAVGTPP